MHRSQNGDAYHFESKSKMMCFPVLDFYLMTDCEIIHNPFFEFMGKMREERAVSSQFLPKRQKLHMKGFSD